MELAMEMAAKCWKRAMDENPEFVLAYLSACEGHLINNETVAGDSFRRVARLEGVILPRALHPNTWVSGPNAMKRMGWISKVGDVEPTELHNHMPIVSLWRSHLYGG
jgi:hypothetical protein